MQEEIINLQNKKTKTSVLLGFVFLFLIFLDQLAKFFVKDPFLNYHFAFSLQVPIFFTYIIYFLVLSGLFYYTYKNYFKLSNLQKIALVFIFAGAASNIVERIILGYVKDFIYIHLGNLVGIYNLADFYIILGILFIVLEPNLKKN